MASTPATAENNTLFEIDEELEGRFDDDAQELEQTGIISEETKQRCLDLFTELGKKVDRIGIGLWNPVCPGQQHMVLHLGKWEATAF